MKPLIDNDVYNRMHDGWWNENSFLNMLETGIHPIRSHYIKQSIKEHCSRKEGLKTLDIGCGGGIISEDLAQQQHDVTGIDISEKSLLTAQKHAEAKKLHIRYLLGDAENLPFPNDSFDLVVCCDVLEHVSDVETVISEISRVLKPEGLFIYDTINKTIVSRIATIDIAQNIPWTRFMPRAY